MLNQTVRDRIAFRSSAGPLRQPAVTLLDCLQQLPADVQVEVLFLTAAAMAETLNLDAHDLVTRAKRLIPAVEADFTHQLQAIRDYAAGELR